MKRAISYLGDKAELIGNYSVRLGFAFGIIIWLLVAFIVWWLTKNIQFAALALSFGTFLYLVARRPYLEVRFAVGGKNLHEWQVNEQPGTAGVELVAFNGNGTKAARFPHVTLYLPRPLPAGFVIQWPHKYVQSFDEVLPHAGTVLQFEWNPMEHEVVHARTSHSMGQLTLSFPSNFRGSFPILYRTSAIDMRSRTGEIRINIGSVTSQDWIETHRSVIGFGSALIGIAGLIVGLLQLFTGSAK